MPDQVVGASLRRYEHHAVITLPQGTEFQVALTAIEECQGGTFVLREDAVIEHVFTEPAWKPKPKILVPMAVIAKLPTA